MPNQFVCHNCGMITDDPEIVPHPERSTMYRKPFSTRFLLSGVVYNHSITCPVCLNETRFWRDIPFPVDVPINK